MLRAAIKHGISRALSTRPGFEVWDFDIKEEQAEGRTTLEIRYRYHPGLLFLAHIAPQRGTQAEYEMTIEVVPGEMSHKETFSVASRQDLFTAIRHWTGRIEEELEARPVNRVLAAQQKALLYLEKHLLDIPDTPMAPSQIREYAKRLDHLETAVIETRDEDGEDAVREEFDSLRDRVGVLGERSFFHAVLVRLVKYFWDDKNLRIVEAGSRAAQCFLADFEPAAPSPTPPPAPKPEPASEPAPEPKREPRPMRSVDEITRDALTDRLRAQIEKTN